MYDYAGQPAKTQAKVREVLRRMYIGSEIGQGYAGDEDNGETSAWYLFSALGFYPLQVGSPYYAIGSPLFEKATIHQENGRDIVINAPQNSAGNVYVQGLKVDGASYDKSYLSHDQLANGATLDFDMGPAPSQWATGAAAAPPSITQDDDVPRPLRDVTGADDDTATTSTAGADAAALFDDTSGTRATLAGVAPWLEYRFAADERHVARFYTLTSGETTGADPSGWTVKGSNDGVKWTVLDQRSGEKFDWRSQTRPFKLDRPSNFSRFRIEFGDPAVKLAEVEFLANEKPVVSPLFAEVENGVAEAGGTAQVAVRLTNEGSAPLSGAVTATVPEGWTVEPASTPFGPIAGGQSQTVTLTVGVPDGAEVGSYPIAVTATSNRATAKAAGTVNVIGNVIEFTPGTDAEQPWLFDAGGSQLDGAVYDGHARFADNGRYFVYRFPIGADVTDGTLRLDLQAEYLVQASTDGTNWDTVLEETRRITDGSNRGWQQIDHVTDLAGPGQTLYLRIADSFPEDGWGGWLARLRLELQTG
jgi:hypothetical protein